MRKRITIIAVVILLQMSLALSVLAGTDGFTQDVETDSSKYHGSLEYSNDTYYASYDNVIADKEYILYVIRNNGTYDNYSLTSDTLLYIDQKYSAASDSINFDFYISNPPSCTVVLAGDGNRIILGTVMKKSPIADVNLDGLVNLLDVVIVAKQYGEKDSIYDLNGDNTINLFDLVIITIDCIF